jgi:hypothetical protein
MHDLIDGHFVALHAALKHGNMDGRALGQCHILPATTFFNRPLHFNRPAKSLALMIEYVTV